MFTNDPSKSISFTRCICDGDLVIVYERHDIMKAVKVCEGTGSGSLTTSLARVVALARHVYTFDFHELRAASTREDFEKMGLNTLVTVAIRDIQGQEFSDEYFGMADSMFLDLP